MMNKMGVGCEKASSTHFIYYKSVIITKSEMDKKRQILSALESYFNHKAEIYHIDMVFLYGSWATGLPKIESDVDIAVVFDREMGRDKLFDIITTLSLELTNLLKIETDVLYIDEEFSKPMLYYNAIVHGIPVFIKSFTRYVDKRLYAIYQMEDFSIFGTGWQAEILEKRMEKLNKVNSQKTEFRSQNKKPVAKPRKVIGQIRSQKSE